MTPSFWSECTAHEIQGTFNRFQDCKTVLLSKHTVRVENQNYYEVVQPLLYITYRGFIYDVTL